MNKKKKHSHKNNTEIDTGGLQIELLALSCAETENINQQTRCGWLLACLQLKRV